MSETHRSSMLHAFRGEPCETIPWAPRMDLWYIALRERGTLPPELEDADIAKIAEYYDIGCHAVRADFTRPRSEDANMFRGIGFDYHPDFPYRFHIDELPVRYDVSGEETKTTVETSTGELTFRLRYSREMRREGISQPFKLEYPIEEPEDLLRAAELFEHLRIVPATDAYEDFRRRVGERGLAVAHGSIAASPFHLLLHELMPMDQFFFWYHDRYNEMKEFEERVAPFFNRLMKVTASSGAEVVLWGTNFDRDITWPPFFQRDIAPWLIRARNTFHETGVLLLCHTDGENSGLFDSYRPIEFDVAESVCAAPMTELSLLEQRRGFGDDVTIWGGIPSVILLPRSTGQDAFTGYLDTLKRSIKKLAPNRSRLIFGVSDNVPPDADLDRLRRIGEWIRSL